MLLNHAKEEDQFQSLEMDSIQPTEFAAAAARRTCHIAAIPYPGRGHINPMMNLCRLLDGRDGITVTVIVTDEWLDLLRSETPPPPHLKSNVQLRPIPNVLPSERTRGDNYAEFMKAVFAKMAEPVRRLLDRLDPPADVVVADALLPWVVDLCEQRNLPAVSLWTESASVLWALYTFERLDAAGELPADFSGHKALTYLPNVSTAGLAYFQTSATVFDLLRSFARKYYWFRTAHSLIMSSFDELESSVMDEIRSEFALPIYQVGPLIPHMLPPAGPSLPNYLSWLDSRPKSAVLYVSLGSFLPTSASRMDVIAAGLADSGVPFLLVSRDHEIGRTGGVEGSAGLVVPWCDQLRVLRHPSVGGFLTHCGWNSTMEAVYAGAPMITFPLFWDQEPNSKLVVEEWGIGRRLVEKDENVTRELTASRVKRFMDVDDEESKCMRVRSEKMKEICWNALNDGGSSSHNLQLFLDHITKTCNNASSHITLSQML